MHSGWRRVVNVQKRRAPAHINGALSRLALRLKPSPEPSTALATIQQPIPAAASAGAQRRGPFRPARLASVRERMSGATLARRYRRVDVAVLALAGAAHLRLLSPQAFFAQPLAVALPVVVATLAAAVALRAADSYALPRREHPLAAALRVLAAVAIGGAALVFATLLEMAFGAAARPEAWGWGAIALPALLLVHGAMWVSIRRWRAQGRLTPNVVVVGATRNAARLIEAALAKRDVNVLGVFDDRLSRAPADVHGVPVLGDTRALIDHPVLPYVDRIVITVSASAQERVRALIDKLKVVPNAVTLFLDVEGEREQEQALTRLTEQPLAQVSGVRQDEGRAAAKRLQDVVVSGVALVVLAPVLAVIALIVKLDSRGPVLFRQRRYGFNNEPISVLKFRTMRTEATDPDSVRQVQAGDPRVTRVGRVLRRTSLDELPQFWNVWSGEMSMVGPRPHAIGMKTAGEDSHRLVAEYAWRHRMKPGITGWAQINGSRGPVDTPEAVRRRVSLDLDYIERQTLSLDLYIMLMTAPRLLGDGAAVR